MSAATLTVPTYRQASGEEDAHSYGSYFDDQRVDLENQNFGSNYTILEYVDELADYSEEARASILRGLKQKATKDLGSFAKYVED